jgi:hypothetical protein
MLLLVMRAMRCSPMAASSSSLSSSSTAAATPSLALPSLSVAHGEQPGVEKKKSPSV